jgi:hypothetical protein
VPAIPSAASSGIGGAFEIMAKRARLAMSILVAAHAAVSATGVARAESPIPLNTTWFGDPPANAEDEHWFAVFGDQTEVALRADAFAAHLTIDRKGGHERDEFVAYFAPRMCLVLTNMRGRTASKCPARLLRYRDGKQLSADQIADVCLVHEGTRPPSPLEAGWNAAQATLRTIDGGTVLVFSAVLDGQLIPGCTISIPLPPAI